MKKNQLSMLLRASMLMLAFLFVFSACKKDDDDDDNGNPPLVEDGMYIKGDATPYTALNNDSQFTMGINEVGQVERSGMYEMYTTLKAGSTFQVVEVEGTTQTTWGPATNEDVVLAGENDQIHATVQKGTLGTTGEFSVDADGMYHVIIDMNTETYIIAPITHWAIIGGATEVGWSDTQLPLVGSFNANEMTWQAEGLILRTGNFKFRYSNGWKIEISGDSVKANTNFGGATQGTLPDLSTTLVPGGADYLLGADQEGVYTVTIKWTAADGYTSSLVKTDDVEPLDYPEQLYIIGASIGGWDWAANAIEMIPVHSKPHLFWKIVWLDADIADGGIKFNSALEWNGDEFGKTGDIANDIFAFGTENVPVPGPTGYYMVTVNFETSEIAVTQPMVYLIGDPVGSWDAGVEANLFTVDNPNMLVTITKELAAGNLRMYAWMDKGWFTDWWQAEFRINPADGMIEYRGTGGDQEAVPVNAGTTTINLNFKDGTGEINQ